MTETNLEPGRLAKQNQTRDNILCKLTAASFKVLLWLVDSLCKQVATPWLINTLFHTSCGTGTHTLDIDNIYFRFLIVKVVSNL
jgi:hypothetical protein